MDKHDIARRFAGIERLYGAGSLQRLMQSHVCVIGIGGVGSWAVETLARSGVAELTLIDLDHVAESNINRQVHALEATLGQEKVTAMRDRLLQINPNCRVNPIDDFLNRDNLKQLLPHCDVIIDCIDQLTAKAALIAHCRLQHLALVTTAGAGGRTDPTQLRIDDLARTSHDPLAARLRTVLRQQYAFPRQPQSRFGIPCVYSTEAIRRPQAPDCAADTRDPQAPQGLSCAGYGSSMAVTAAFGMAAAAHCLGILLE